MISRRGFLLASGAAVAASVAAGGVWASLARIVSDESYICAVLRRDLRGFHYSEADLRIFARAFLGQITISRTQRLATLAGLSHVLPPLLNAVAPSRHANVERQERLVFSSFLISTDFFDRGRAPAAPLVYRGYSGPPICNPLATLRDS